MLPAGQGQAPGGGWRIRADSVITGGVGSPRLWITLAAGSLSAAVCAFVYLRSPATAEPVELFDVHPIHGRILKKSHRWRHRTDQFDVTVRTNGRRMREGRVEVPKPASTYRILVFGDSITFGWGVERRDTWVVRLERRLAAVDPRVEVLNGSTPGSSPDHYYLRMRHGALDVDPDLVLVQICTNDLANLAMEEVRVDERGLPRALKPKRMISEHEARLLARMAERADVRLDELDFTALAAGEGDPSDEQKARMLFNRARRRYRRSLGANVPTGPIEELSGPQIRIALRALSFQLRYMRHILDAIVDECHQRDVPVRFLLTHPSCLPEAKHIVALRELCAERDPPCWETFDLLPPNHDAAPHMFYERDGHWRAPAHRMVAEGLAAWLLEDDELELGG